MKTFYISFFYPKICKTGYEYIFNVGCKDINECLSGVCGKKGCINLPGSYICETTTTVVSTTTEFDCPTGYKKDYRYSGNADCIDIDECDNLPKVCKKGSSCQNTLGSFKCVENCKRGFRRLSILKSCEDIDECGFCDPMTDMCPCEKGMQCKNTAGSFTVN